MERTGCGEAKRYLAQVYSPELEYTQYDVFSALPLVDSGLSLRLLLGRTFLQKLMLNYNGLTGEASLSRYHVKRFSAV